MIVQHLGFGPIWHDMVSRLLASASTRVLINSRPEHTILHQRGLRQGDPLYPMLFVLVMDVLFYMVKMAANVSLLQPLSGRTMVTFLHPTFVDLGIKFDILKIFGDPSGLRTNMEKSSVLPTQC
jgi:hypothetical protein